MLEVGEAVAAALDLLHEDVEAFGRTVAGPGVMVGEDLGASRGERLAEGRDLAVYGRTGTAPARIRPIAEIAYAPRTGENPKITRRTIGDPP